MLTAACKCTPWRLLLHTPVANGYDVYVLSRESRRIEVIFDHSSPFKICSSLDVVSRPSCFWHLERAHLWFGIFVGPSLFVLEYSVAIGWWATTPAHSADVAFTFQRARSKTSTKGERSSSVAEAFWNWFWKRCRKRVRNLEISFPRHGSPPGLWLI
jgi:hypothetical protein